MNWKRKFSIIAVPAVLALAGGVVAVQAAQSPSPPPAPTTTAPATTAPSESTETPETAAEQVDVNEPSLPGGGHADAPGANVDHQFEGVE